jgi:chromosome segregation ATPase
MAPATKEDVLKSKNVNFLLDQIKSIWDENATLKKGNDYLNDKLQKKRAEILSLQGEIGKLKSAQKTAKSSCGSCSHNCCQKLKECNKELHSRQKDLACREMQLQRPNNAIIIYANNLHHTVYNNRTTH